ncbi:MAG: class I SAM-dependent methyltransferase [Thermodesulfobacteriota bacterium]
MRDAVMQSDASELPAGRDGASRFSDRFHAVRCSSCGADDYRVEIELDEDYEYLGIIDDWYSRGPFRIVRCNRCSLVYLNPQPTLEEVLHYYPDEYCCFAELPPKSPLIKLMYKVLVRLKARELLPRLPDDGIFLDFGCGTGHWLTALEPLAKPTQRFVGIDANEGAIAQLRAAGIEGHVGDDALLAELFEENSVDLILLNHVIEHVPDPKETLRRLAAVLKPGGTIHTTTPNIEAWDRWLFGKHWVGGWHAPRHFTHFDTGSIARLAADAGLEVARLKTSVEAASHWALGMQAALGRRIGWHPRRGRSRMRIYPLMLALSMPIAGVQAVVSETSVMTIDLRKRA